MKQLGKAPVWVIYDAQCPICRRLAHWQYKAGDPQVRYADWSEGVRRFPGLNEKALREAVHLVQADGQVYKGAGAIFRLMARRGVLWKAPWVLYRLVPGFAPLCEWVYGWVARHRPRSRVIAGAKG